MPNGKAVSYVTQKDLDEKGKFIYMDVKRDFDKVDKVIDKHKASVNDDIRELRENDKSQSENLTTLMTLGTETKTNVKWMMRAFWLVATTSVGSFVALIFEIFGN